MARRGPMADHSPPRSGALASAATDWVQAVAFLGPLGAAAALITARAALLDAACGGGAGRAHPDGPFRAQEAAAEPYPNKAEPVLCSAIRPGRSTVARAHGADTLPFAVWTGGAEDVVPWSARRAWPAAPTVSASVPP